MAKPNLFRHAIAPGGGDPPDWRLGDCATQRNLDGTGRGQARRIGEAIRAAEVTIGAVLASECAAPGRPPNSPSPVASWWRPSSTRSLRIAAKAILHAWSGPDALFVSTHQVNITALTGIVPASGEGVVLGREGDALVVVGRIRS